MRSISSTLGLLLLLGITISKDAVAESPDFDHLIAPLLARRCLSCHNGHEPKGGLNLSTRDSAMTGGDSGKVLQAGDGGRRRQRGDDREYWCSGDFPIRELCVSAHILVLY